MRILLIIPIALIALVTSQYSSVATTGYVPTNDHLKPVLAIRATKQAEADKQALEAQKAVEVPVVVSNRVFTSGVEQWRALTAKYFGSEVDYALRIMQCESGGNSGALSHTGDRGLMQVNHVHAAKVGGNLDLLYDPETNLRVAKQIRDGSGWAAWSCNYKI